MTEAQIADLKKKYGTVYAVHVYPKRTQTSVELKDENNKFTIEMVFTGDKSEKLTGYFRKPSAAVWGEALKYAEKDPIRFQMELFAGCWIEGDQGIKDDDELRLSAATQLGGLFKYRESEVEEL